jgi:two-component system, NarL family, sensor kinase
MKITFRYILYLFISLPCFGQSTQSIKLSSASAYQKVIELTKRSSELRARNTDSAILLTNEALSISEKFNLQNGKARALTSLSNCYNNTGNYETAFQYSTLAISIAKEIKNDTILAIAYNSITNYYYNKSQYDNAIQASFTTARLFEKIKDYEGVLSAKIGLAQIYQQRKEIDKTEKTLLECMTLLSKVNNSKLKTNTMHTLANVYGMQEKYALALQLDNEGLAICEKENLAFIKSQFYDNMANCYMYSGNYILAKKYFLESLKIDSSFGNKKQMSDTYLNLGNLYLMQKKYAGAKENLLHSIVLANTSGYKQGEYEAYNLLSQTNTKLNNPIEALESIKKAYIIKDSIFSDKSESKIAEMEAIYLTEKKEQSIKVQNLKLRNKNYLIWGLISAIALLIFIGGLVLYNFNLRKESKRKEELHNLAMGISKERERLSKDLHDHLGTSLVTMISQTDNIENKLINNKIEEALAKVQQLSEQSRASMNVLRETIWAVQETTHTLNEFTLRVRIFLERVMGAHEINWNLNAVGDLNKDLSPEQTLHLFRMIQEVTQNILKHASANNAVYVIEANEQKLKISITDDGKGFDTNANYVSNGLNNLSARIKELDGEINITSAIQKGTTIIVQLSI